MRFSEEESQAFSEILSRERIEHWKSLAKHQNMAAWRTRSGCPSVVTDEYAVALHEWNSVMAFAVMSSLEILEISLRNHMHKSLSENLGTNTWWGKETSKGVWTPSSAVVGEQKEDVAKAIRVSGRRSKGVTPGGVISELSFGFWLAILGNNYDNPSSGVAHWRNCLHEVFEKRGKVSRKDAFGELENIVRLRNKCAHHEPIVGLDLNAEYLKMISFARRFSRPTAVWIGRTSLIPHLLKPEWVEALKISGRLIGIS